MMNPFSALKTRLASRPEKPRSTIDNLQKNIIIFHAGLQIHQERNDVLLRKDHVPAQLRYVLDMFLHKPISLISERAKTDDKFQKDLIDFFNSF